MIYLNKKQNAGFSLIEVILSSSIFISFATIFIGAYLFGQESTVLAGARARAVIFADEGVEAVRGMRDDDFGGLVDGVYGLDNVNGKWELSNNGDTLDIFTRSVQIATVSEDIKQVISKVEWQQNNQRDGEVLLTARLSNWMKIIPIDIVNIGDWTKAVQESEFNMGGSRNGIKIKIKDEYAFIARTLARDDLEIVNVSDTKNISEVSGTGLRGVVKDMDLAGNYAYFATTNRFDEVAVMDISDVDSPVVVGTYDTPFHQALVSVHIEGSFLYLTRRLNNNFEFFILDVSAPESPTLVGGYEMSANANDVYIKGNYIYIASAQNSGEVHVVNIANKSNPTLVRLVNLDGNVDAVVLKGFGDTLIVGRGKRANGSIDILDITDPERPEEISSYDGGGYIRDVDLFNDNKYLAVASDVDDAEFQVLDISVLANPVLINSIDISNDLNSLDCVGSLDKCFAVGDSNTEELVVIAPE